MTEAEKIAAGLSHRAAKAVLYFSGEWKAGPEHPDAIIDRISELRILGLIEREFGDMGSPELTVQKAGFRARLSACWWHRLTPLGLAVRAALEHQREK